jgi:hypothetical protein
MAKDGSRRSVRKFCAASSAEAMMAAAHSMAFARTYGFLMALLLKGLNR